MPQNTPMPVKNIQPKMPKRGSELPILNRMTLFHFVRLAFHNLRRGGQRILVALLCITFGITALVAMTMIAKSIESSLFVEPAQLVGGDLSLVLKTGAFLRPEHINQLNALQQSGAISNYTLIAYNNESIMLHTPGSAETHFVGLGMGIEPDKYPLAGSLTIGEPDSGSLQELLQQVGDVVVTRDIAVEYQLKVGDLIVLSDLHSGVPLESTVRGVAYDTPNHQGDKVYYTIATAQALSNGRTGFSELSSVNTVIANTTQAKTATETLENSGWSVDWVAGRTEKKTANAWVFGLRGAGILGLLVGGIGIANTMQVLLRRRQHEIAIWKTLGYGEGDLRLIFVLEAGLLGLAGSLLGAGLGILISSQVLELIRNISIVLYQWTFSPTPPVMGVLVGTLTTVIFAFWAIIVSSQATPMALLRNERIEIKPLSGCLSAVLGLLLALPFTVITSLVMESAAAGIGMLICLVIGIAGMGGIFSGMLWVSTRVLPLRGFHLVRMAFNSLCRRGFSLVFAMIALFVGVLSMSLGLAVAQFGEIKTSGGGVDFEGYNLNILAAAYQENAIRLAVEVQNPQRVSLGYRTALEALNVVGGGPVSAMDAVLVGRSDTAGYSINGADWGSQPDGVYAYKAANLEAGSQVEATFRDGTTRTFTVVGSYVLNYSSSNLYPLTGLLMTTEAFNRVTQPDSITYFVQVVPNEVNRAAVALSAALPQATVVNLIAYAGRFMRSYQKLFILPMALSGLAVLAGLLLVANSVSLAMLDRNYEIGILKTIGYSQRQILSIFAFEYGLVGLLATGAGVLVIEAFLAALALATKLPASLLLLSFPALALIAFCGVGLTLLTVFGVTWAPIHVSPIAILNEGN